MATLLPPTVAARSFRALAVAVRVDPAGQTEFPFKPPEPAKRAHHARPPRARKASSPLMALVELRNVSKIYHLGGEEIRALDDLSLDIEGGEFISIIGPSGSGKSTLMHILGCLDSPTKGTINL